MHCHFNTYVAVNCAGKSTRRPRTPKVNVDILSSVIALVLPDGWLRNIDFGVEGGQWGWRSPAMRSGCPKFFFGRVGRK